MARIITCNTNGIRAAARKGFFDWLPTQDADVVCIQETKAQEHQLSDPVFKPEGYHCFYNDALKPGYSGTALYSRVKPRQVTTSLGWDPADAEGRYLQADYRGLSVISLYLPSGSSSEAAQERKFRFMESFLDHLRALRRKRREFIICADWNICHKEIDLKNWRANRKNSGFLPEERAWMDQLFAGHWRDSFRLLEPDKAAYTWWSNRGRAWDNDVGWRIDYQILSANLADNVKAVSIYRDQRFSDHAPYTVDYSLPRLRARQAGVAGERG